MNMKLYLMKINKTRILASLNLDKSINIHKLNRRLEIYKDADIALSDIKINCCMSIACGEIIFNNLDK